MKKLKVHALLPIVVPRLNRLSVLALVPLFVAACGGGGGGGGIGYGGGQPPPAYTVGGTISGLSGTVVLRNNGGDDLSVGSNGAFQFGTAIPSGGAYNITVKTQPTNQTCALSGGGSGVVGTSNITSVVVTCTNNPANTYTVGGAVAGLTGTLVLTNTRGANAIDDLSITANGGFTFPTAIATNGTYAVAVKTQPAGQTCVVANDHGTIGVANVTNVLITCAANPPNALQADAGVHSATLTWTAPIGFGGTSFNVYVSSARHCDIGHYAACPDGAMLTNVVSPQTVTNLRNGQAYFFQLESVFANGVRAISTEVGARPNAISFNGIVSAIAPAANGTVYVGGSFTQVGVTTGAAIPLDVVTGRLAAPDFPIVDGSVNAVAADGVGGWYIGGSFSSVGGISRENLAHVRSDGTVDPAWAPAADEIVNAIVVSGNTVYVGGGFGRIGTDFRTHLAAIDAVTGVTRSWNPVANGVVYALAVSGNTVYVGGFFDHIGPDARNSVAAIDTTTGVATPWNPNIENGQVLALTVANNTVYVGGQFSHVGSESRDYLAAIDATTGAATTWNPGAVGLVYALAVADSTVYVGGSFGQVGSEPRNNIAAVNAVTGVVTSWNPNASGSVNVFAIANNTIYVGGSFRSIGPDPRNHLAAIDVNTGVATGWNPNANYSVAALAVSGNTAYAGGFFSSVGAAVRNNLAALDAGGALKAWNPNVGNTGVPAVYALTVLGNTVYAGGDFNKIGNDVRNNLAAIDATTGVATAWNPNADSVVYTLLLSDSTVYAGGDFAQIGLELRRHLAAIDATSGAATPWNPSIDNDPNNSVYALAMSGNTVYAGGRFKKFGDDSRNNLAAIDAITGAATSWNPNANSLVFALAVTGNTVYAGGAFGQIGGDIRSRLAAIDATTGAATSWNPSINGVFSSTVYALAVRENVVYVGGDFATVGGVAGAPIPRHNAASFYALGTGIVTEEWDPDPTDLVNDLAVSGNTIYVGGYFRGLRDTARSFFGAVDVATGDIIP